MVDLLRDSTGGHEAEGAGCWVFEVARVSPERREGDDGRSLREHGLEMAERKAVCRVSRRKNPCRFELRPEKTCWVRERQLWRALIWWIGLSCVGALGLAACEKSRLALA